MARATRFTGIVIRTKNTTDIPLQILDSNGVEIARVGNSGYGANRLAEVAITAAQALTLRATPKLLVAAPGAGLYLEFVSLELFLDYGGTAYTESAANLVVRFTGTTGTIVSQAIEATGFADATGDTATNGLPKIDAISAKAACENQGLYLHNTGAGEWANSGNSPLRAKIIYRIHKTDW